MVRFGQGWIPWGDEAANLTESIPAMKAAVREAGGDGANLQVCGNINPAVEGNRLDVAATMRPVPALVAAGLTDVRCRVHTWAPTGTDATAEYLGELVAAFHAVTR